MRAPGRLRSIPLSAVVQRLAVRVLVVLAAAMSAAFVVPAPAEAYTAVERGWRVAYYAKNQVGDPYRYGAAGPSAFDCSGLVKAAYRWATGRYLPHSSQQISGMGYKVASRYVRPGDVVYWGGRGSAYHVGVVVQTGPIRFVHAPKPGYSVTRSAPWGGEGYLRLIN
jgi:cell wall-associated NlpC family hydrolase